MLIKDKELDARLDKNMVSPEELGNYLARNYSVFELATELAGYLIEDRLYQKNMIILTPAQQDMLQVMFRKVSRPMHTDKGRKPKTEKYLKQRDELLFKK